MPDDSNKDYARRQSKHATRIATERALMDTFGMSRSQARQMNEGLEELGRRHGFQTPVPQRTPPPAPGKVEISEAKTEKAAPVIGRPKVVQAPAGDGGGVPAGNLEVQGLVRDGTTVTAEWFSLYGTLIP